MLAYLKIKIKSLAVEAQIIRKEEQKFKKRRGETCREIFWGLRNHRTQDVRSESRSALIAYGFLKGKSYASIEPPGTGKKGRRPQPDWVRINQLIVKYGVNKDAANIKKAVEVWKDPEALKKAA